jgi:hypothetical protein
MKKNILVIVGMHRSGTSLITQWLHRCGLHAGEHFLGPGVGNKDGHFEDTDFLKFHEHVLKLNDLPKTGLTEKPVLNISMDAKEKLQNIILAKSKLNTQWGWKDPRTSLFLPLYRELIPGAGYLIIVRDYQASVNSLIKRKYQQAERRHLTKGWFKKFLWKIIPGTERREKMYRQYTEAYLKVWIAYNEKILEHLRLLPAIDYTVTDYEMLKTDDRPLFLHLKNNWHFCLDYVPFKEIYNESLMGNTEAVIEPFVKNKTLLSRAKDIENNLRNYM